MNRSDVLDELAASITVVSCNHPIRVAIDGIDASGKTTLANELVQPVERLGYQVIRASIDKFQRSRDIRHHRGSLSPEGYYYDAFDYEAFKGALLEPLGANGTRCYYTEHFDLRENVKIEPSWKQADERSVLIVDGVFLQRPEINAYWDLRIWVDVPFEVALERACQRDLELFGTVDVVRERYAKRYFPAQQLYIEQCQPKMSAQWVIDNLDPLQPYLHRNELFRN